MRVLIADDHPLFLEAVQIQLERAKPGVEIRLARSLDEAMQVLRGAGTADIVLLDYAMPGMNGTAGLARLRAEFPALPVMIMSGTASVQDVAAAIRAGANGFLPKTLEPKVFVSAFDVVLAGGTYLPTEMAASGEPTVPTGNRPLSVPVPGTSVTLTGREVQVLQAIVSGRSNKEIARALELEEVTIKLHARRIYQKLGARNRAEATAIAVEQGLVQRTLG